MDQSHVRSSTAGKKTEFRAELGTEPLHRVKVTAKISKSVQRERFVAVSLEVVGSRFAEPLISALKVRAVCCDRKRVGEPCRALPAGIEKSPTGGKRGEGAGRKAKAND